MSTSLIIIITFLSVGIFVAILVIAENAKEKKRASRLEELAQSLSFLFISKTDFQFISKIGLFDLFNQGRFKKIYNILEGQYQGQNICYFDYTYTTGSGKSSHTWKLSALWVKEEDEEFPEFFIRPENFVDKLKNKFGKPDINFYDDPEFSKKYYLQGNNPEKVMKVFTPQIRTSLIQSKGVHIQGNNKNLLLYRPVKREKIENIQQFIDEMLHLYFLLREGLKD